MLEYSNIGLSEATETMTFAHAQYASLAGGVLEKKTDKKLIHLVNSLFNSSLLDPLWYPLLFSAQPKGVV